MPTYQYIAKDSAGQTRSGMMEAETNSVAVARLREQGLWVTRLHAHGVRASASSGGVRERLIDPIWSGVSLRDLAFFFRQFATLIDAGMPINQALSTLAPQAPNAKLRQIVAQIAAQVQNGSQLSAAMRRFPWVFSSLQVHMIEAAEAGGLLDQMMLRIADYLEREYEIRQKVKQKTLYPKLVLLAAIFIPNIVILIFGGLMPYLHSTLFTVLPFLLGGLAIWAACRLGFQWSPFRYAYDTVKLNLPVVGGLIRKQVTGKFARGLSALYGAGAAGRPRDVLGRRGVWKSPGCRHGPSTGAACRAGRVAHRGALRHRLLLPRRARHGFNGRTGGQCRRDAREAGRLPGVRGGPPHPATGDGRLDSLLPAGGALRRLHRHPLLWRLCQWHQRHRWTVIQWSVVKRHGPGPRF